MDPRYAADGISAFWLKSEEKEELSYSLRVSGMMT